MGNPMLTPMLTPMGTTVLGRLRGGLVVVSAVSGCWGRRGSVAVPAMLGRLKGGIGRW